jgi:hypothetical protein
MVPEQQRSISGLLARVPPLDVGEAGLDICDPGQVKGKG